MIFHKIRNRKPLVHNITNYVAAPLQANGLLAIGASPLMADDPTEVAEIVQIIDALLINIGTLNVRTVEAMLVAGKAANERGIPIVLDPVGVGVSQLRKNTVKQLLETIQFSLIRCNAGELAAIANVSWMQKGVDSGEGDMDIEAEATKIAKNYNCYVIVTGEQDLLTDGETTYYISGGHIQMTEITATGCLLSSICAATLTLQTDDALHNLYDCLASYKLVAENAIETGSLLGDFGYSILNELYKLSKETGQ